MSVVVLACQPYPAVHTVQLVCWLANHTLRYIKCSWCAGLPTISCGTQSTVGVLACQTHPAILIVIYRLALQDACGQCGCNANLAIRCYIAEWEEIKLHHPEQKLARSLVRYFLSWKQTQTHTQTHTNMHTNTQTHIQTHTQTHKHAHKHTNMFKFHAQIIKVTIEKLFILTVYSVSYIYISDTPTGVQCYNTGTVWLL